MFDGVSYYGPQPYLVGKLMISPGSQRAGWYPLFAAAVVVAAAALLWQQCLLEGDLSGYLDR